MGNAVKNYYDNNTRYFLKFGQHYSSANIHQALWPPEVKTKLEAVNYSNYLILQEIKTHLKEGQILDLGCGVGSSLLYLSTQLQEHFNFIGISISSEQIKMACAFAEKAEEEKVNFIEGSFQDLPSSIQNISLAYSIEAFVHSPDAAGYFEEVSRVLNKNGRLILIDDFLTTPTAETQVYKKTIDNFKKGWHLGSLCTIKQVSELAQKAGLKLTKQQNLTNWHPKNRIKDHLLHWSLPFCFPPFKQSTYGLSLVGGDARWVALRKNWINYQLLVFEKID